MRGQRQTRIYKNSGRYCLRQTAGDLSQDFLDSHLCLTQGKHLIIEIQVTLLGQELTPLRFYLWTKG